MNIPKAIEILEDIIHYVEPGDPPEEHDAVRLGIEAMKRVQACRPVDCYAPKILLPGETKEGD